MLYLYFFLWYIFIKDSCQEGESVNIGKKIMERRRKLGMTQDALARELSISPQAVSRWENGWNLPDIENIGLIAKVLKVSPSSLIGQDRQSYEWELREQLYSEEHMFTRLKTIAEISGQKETYRALYYIRDQHNGQYRKKLKYSDAKIPYIIHPLMMACHAQSMGLNDDQLLAVILLHDVCEDCGIMPEELPFSKEVQEAVALLTKDFDPNISERENETRYYNALSHNHLAALAKVIDRCNNVSTMAGSFNDKKIAGYIEETETYVFPVLSVIKQTWPEYNNAVFLIKYQMLSVLESLKIMLSEKQV